MLSSSIITCYYLYSYHRLFPKDSRTCCIRCHRYHHFRYTWEHKNWPKDTSLSPYLDGMSNYYKILAHITENQISVFSKKVRNFNEMGNSRFWPNAWPEIHSIINTIPSRWRRSFCAIAKTSKFYKIKVIAKS